MAMHGPHGLARWLPALALAAAAAALAGCSVAAQVVGTAHPYPAGCAAYGLSRPRCDAIVAWARDELPSGHPEIVSTQLLPDPGCPGQPPGVLCVRTTQFVTTVRFTLADGSTSDHPLYCGVGPPTLLCSNDPGLEAIDLHQAGYWDVPCTGDPSQGPSGCATPFPSPDPSTLAAGRPLRIAALDVPVGGVGHHEVDVGEAVLPDGIVSEATFRLANTDQHGFSIEPGTVTLELRSTIPGRPPFTNAYVRGVFPGSEAVRVLLVYDVASSTPGADPLEVRDLVVR